MTSMLRPAAVLLLTCVLAGCSIGTSTDEPTASYVRTEDVPPVRGAFHEDRPYRLQNSFRGLRLAAETDAWIDIDSQYCWDSAGRHRIAIATHWPNIGREQFTDPANRLDPVAAFADLTLPAVRRLRSTDPEPYRISTMEEMVRAAARIGLKGIEWEVKGGTAFERPDIYRQVLTAAAEVGIRINVKTLATIGGKRAALRRLKAAKRAGATTMLLNRGPGPARITDTQSRYVDYVR
jgi:hypothetical protein